MTPSRAAQEKPTSPRTEAGREQLEWCDRVQSDDRNRERILRIEDEARADLLRLVIEAGSEYAARRGPVMPAMERLQRAASERETAAATPSLVAEVPETLRQWLVDQSRLAHEQANILPGDPTHAWDAGAAHMADATLTELSTQMDYAVASDEYARLDEGSATPEPDHSFSDTVPLDTPVTPGTFAGWDDEETDGSATPNPDQ